MTQAPMRSDARTNHARLLAAAREVFAAHGTDAEVKEIAECAGLAVGTIYRHFPSKDELVAAVMEEAVQEFRQAVDAGLATAEPLASLEVFVRGSVGVLARYGELIAAQLEGRTPDVRAATVRASRKAAVGERMTELIQRGMDAGVLRPAADAEAVATFLRAALAPWVLAELRLGVGLEEIGRSFLQLFLYGAGQPSTGDPLPADL